MKVQFGIVKILLLCTILIFSNHIISQEEEIIEEEIEATIKNVKEVISISDLAKLMNVPDNEIIISDYRIISTNDDSDFLIDKIFFSLYQIHPQSESTKKLYFYNCEFNLDDDAPLVFTGWKLSRLNLIGCEFLSPIGFENFLHIGKHPFLIENCIFRDEV
ncbi:MAG: hypothetical protein QM503_01150, partial [Bacteroidota bacterium]